MARVLKIAIETFNNDKPRWNSMVKRAMEAESDWAAIEPQFANMYSNAIAKKRLGAESARNALMTATVANGAVTLAYKAYTETRLSVEEETMIKNSIKNWLGSLNSNSTAILETKSYTLPILISSNPNEAAEHRADRMVINRTLLRGPPANDCQLFLHGLVFYEGYRFLHPEASKATAQQLLIEYLNNQPAILDATLRVLTPENVNLTGATPQLLSILRDLKEGRNQEFSMTIPAADAEILADIQEEFNGRMRFNRSPGPDGRPINRPVINGYMTIWIDQ